MVLLAHKDAKQPTTNYIVRPVQKGTKVFAEKGMTARASVIACHGHVSCGSLV